MNKKSRSVRDLEALVRKTRKAAEQAKKQKAKWEKVDGKPDEATDDEAEKLFNEGKERPY